MLQLVQDLQQKKLQNVYKKHGVNYVGLFGSAARGEDTLESDIDLLIDFDETKTLFDLARIKIVLQDTVGKKVDLALKGNIKKQLKPFILQDLITVYEKN